MTRRVAPDAGQADLCFVTAADGNFFALLRGLVASIRTHARFAARPVAVLDLGLSQRQRAILAPHNVKFVVPDWDYPAPPQTPGYLRAMTARPNLPRHVPGHAFLLWLDADAWVQEPSAIDMFVEAADMRGFAAVAEADRAYTPRMSSMSFREWRLKVYSEAFDDRLAVALADFPTLNCGAFCAAADAPHWAAWSRLLASSIERVGLGFFSEQVAFNVMLYTGGLRHTLLPPTCNWICSLALPALDAETGRLVEPTYPFEPIGVVHMTTDRKDGEWTLDRVDAGETRRSLRCPWPLPGADAAG